MERRLLDTGCDSYASCALCARQGGCGWCDGSSQGVCQAKESTCEVARVIMDEPHCSNVGASVSGTINNVHHVLVFGVAPRASRQFEAPP